MSADEFTRFDVSRRQMLKLSALLTAGGAAPLLRAYDARAQDADAPLRIGYLPITDATPLLVAHGKGFFEEQGIKAEKPCGCGAGHSFWKPLSPDRSTPSIFCRP